MINFKGKAPKFKTDQIITVRGKLRLNDSNLDELNFILDDSEIQEKWHLQLQFTRRKHIPGMIGQ